MLNLTYNSKNIIGFNPTLLYDNLLKLKEKDHSAYSEIHSFMLNNNIYDFRITANEENSKSISLTTMDTKHQHILFDSINYKTILGIEDKVITTYKIKVYNTVMLITGFTSIEGKQKCIAENEKEYFSKLSEYLPQAITHCANIHKLECRYNTTQEGVFKFWKIVETVILNEINKSYLNSLKGFRANA